MVPGAPRCANVIDVTDAATHAQIKLSMDQAAEPIAGTLEDQTGTSRPFLGWMELISAIEDARSALISDAAAADSAERFQGGM